MTDTTLVQRAPAPAQTAAETCAQQPPQHDGASAAAALPPAFAEFGLAPELLRAIADLGYEQPTAVQRKTIPLAMGADDAGGRCIDLMVSSQTGSGKTAAFLLPLLHTLLRQQTKAYQEATAAAAGGDGAAADKRAKRKTPGNPRSLAPATPGALILCPTRELAQQVAQDAIDLVRHCRGLRVASVVGGMPYQLQLARLANANLVVANARAPAGLAALAANPARPGAVPGR